MVVVPLAPKRPCKTPGCPGTTRQGKWCERCKGTRHAGTLDDTAARKADKRFIKSLPWRRLRLRKRAAQPVCQDCEARGRTTVAIEVDHVLPRKQRPDLALAWSNLRALCKPCHSRKTRGEMSH